MPLPDFLADAPTLLDGLDVYWTAFVELSTCRPYIGLDGAPGPIPWTAIIGYSQTMNLDATWTVSLVRAMDDEFLAWAREARNV